jgi:GT2 family glycosyltransferase
MTAGVAFRHAAAAVDEPPVLSIITVTYNSRAEIGACLSSIPVELCGRPVEVIIVDNDSSDCTLDYVRTNYPHVTRIAAGDNLGFGPANDIGFAASRGDYLLFLNPDTESNSSALEHCLRRLANGPDIGIISPRLVMADGRMDPACRRSIPNAWDGVTRATGICRLFPRVKWLAGYNLTYLPDDGTYPVGAVNGAFMMMRRPLFTALGLFDEKIFMYGDDLDICYRCTRMGYQVVYEGRQSIIHLKGRSSSANPTLTSRNLFRGTTQFYLKHFNPNGSSLVRWKYLFLFSIWSTSTILLGRIAAYGKIQRKI